MFQHIEKCDEIVTLIRNALQFRQACVADRSSEARACQCPCFIIDFKAVDDYVAGQVAAHHILSKVLSKSVARIQVLGVGRKPLGGNAQRARARVFGPSQQRLPLRNAPLDQVPANAAPARAWVYLPHNRGHCLVSTFLQAYRAYTQQIAIVAPRANRWRTSIQVAR